MLRDRHNASSSISAKRSSPSYPLDKSIDELWQHATLSAQAVKQSFLASKLQHDITARIEQGMYTDLFNDSSRYHQTILTAISRNFAVSGYLTQLPTEPEYRMRDEAFRLAVRTRFGMMPYDQLRQERCEGCKSNLRETLAFANDPDHFHSCGHTTRKSVTNRHDQLKFAIAKLARSVGFVVIVEPKFPATVVHNINPATGTSTMSFTQPPSELRDDLLLIRHDKKLLLDIRVCRPTNNTVLAAHAKVNVEPLITAMAHEQQKHQHYDAECAKHEWTLIPVVFETYGGIGKEVVMLG
jgi:hypothetical protein